MLNHRLAKYQASFPQDKTIRHACIRTSTPSRKSKDNDYVDYIVIVWPSRNLVNDYIPLTYNHYICDSGYFQVPHICYSSHKIWIKIESCQWGVWFPCLNPATDTVVRPLFYYKSAIVISFHTAYYYCITKKRARSYSSLTCDSLIVQRFNICYIKDSR